MLVNSPYAIFFHTDFQPFCFQASQIPLLRISLYTLAVVSVHLLSIFIINQAVNVTVRNKTHKKMNLGVQAILCSSPVQSILELTRSKSPAYCQLSQYTVGNLTHEKFPSGSSSTNRIQLSIPTSDRGMFFSGQIIEF